MKKFIDSCNVVCVMSEPINITNTPPLLIPMPGKVYLKRLDPDTAASAFIIPDAAKEKGTEAEVLAIPSQPNYEYGVLVPCPLSVGDRVIIGKYSGEHDWAGRKITVVRIDEVLAVIGESPKPVTYGQINRDAAKEYVEAGNKGIPLLRDKTDE